MRRLIELHLADYVLCLGMILIAITVIWNFTKEGLDCVFGFKSISMIGFGVVLILVSRAIEG